MKKPFIDCFDFEKRKINLFFLTKDVFEKTICV